MMQRGKLLARALTGAWRLSPPPLSLSARELAEITPLLLRSGGAGVVWWQARHTHLRTSSAAAQLRDAYRLHTLQAALHERELLQVIPALQAAGVDPLLAKGWAVARFYPAQGLRPYGDLDLYVRPEQYAVAAAGRYSHGLAFLALSLPALLIKPRSTPSRFWPCSPTVRSAPAP